MALVKADQTPANPVKAPDRDVPNQILRDQYRRPMIVRPDGTVGSYSRASSVGDVVEDQRGLSTWRMQQVAWGIAHSRPLRARGQSIEGTRTRQDKEALRSLAWDAFEYADSNAAAQMGTALHALTERLDAGEPMPDIDDELQPALDAYAKIAAGFTFHGMEQFIVCDQFEIAGTFDRIAAPKGDMQPTDKKGRPIGPVIPAGSRLVWDLKTSSTANYFGAKFVAQLGAYALGVRYRGWQDPDVVARQREQGCDEYHLTPAEKVERTRGERLPWPDGIAPRTDWALIVHVPADGPENPNDPPARLHWVKLAEVRELLTHARATMAWRSRAKGFITPAEPPRVPLPPGLSDAGLASLIDAVDPPTKDAFNALWAQHRSVWTKFHTARAEQRLESA